jgi:hypothetical protein
MAGQYDMERRRPTCVGTVPTLNGSFCTRLQGEQILLFQHGRKHTKLT